MNNSFDKIKHDMRMSLIAYICYSLIMYVLLPKLLGDDIFWRVYSLCFMITWIFVGIKTIYHVWRYFLYFLHRNGYWTHPEVVPFCNGMKVASCRQMSLQKWIWKHHITDNMRLISVDCLCAAIKHPSGVICFGWCHTDYHPIHAYMRLLGLFDDSPECVFGYISPSGHFIEDANKQVITAMA